MPFCPQCLTEHASSVGACPQCGSALVKRLSKKKRDPSFEELPWPKDNAGNPLPPALLQYCPDHQQLQMTRTFLAAFDIPTTIIEPNRSTFSTVLFGTELLGADLYVPADRLEEARTILDTPYEESDDEEPEGKEPDTAK